MTDQSSSEIYKTLIVISSILYDWKHSELAYGYRWRYKRSNGLYLWLIYDITRDSIITNSNKLSALFKAKGYKVL